MVKTRGRKGSFAGLSETGLFSSSQPRGDGKTKRKKEFHCTGFDPRSVISRAEFREVQIAKTFWVPW